MAGGQKKPGVSMGGLQESPGRRKRRAKARTREEKSWAEKSGPVKVYYRDPETGEEREQPPA